MTKKAQLTIFIILGIIILIGVIVYLGIEKEALAGKLKPSRELITEEVPIEFQPVVPFIERCIQEISEEGLKIIGERGGFINPSSSGFVSSSNPTESDAVKMSPGSEYSVPYWHYMKSKNICHTKCDFVSVPDNLLYLYKDEGEPSIEGQLEEYINNHLNDCLADFKVLKGLGFEVDKLGKPETTVSIRDNDVSIEVNYPLEFKKVSKKKISKFYTTISVNIKAMYELAKEIVNLQKQYRYLERDLLNIIVGFSGIDANKLPPMHQTRVRFGDEVKWPVAKVKTDINNILSSYIQLIQVKNTLNYEPRYMEDILSNILYNSGMLLPVSGNYPNLEASFTYNDWWPIYFDINCREVCKPESTSSNLIALIGIQRYSFAYDISFPVLIEIRDPYAFNYKGYSFYFFIESNIRDNSVMEANYLPPLVLDTGASMLCDEDKRNSGNITINVVDSDGYELSDAEIIFTCSDDNCNIGKTEDGTLAAQFPLCLGGVVSALKQGYISESKPIDTEEGTTGSLTLTLNPIMIKKFIVKKKLIEKKGRYWIPTMKIMDLKPNEEASITLERMGLLNEEEFHTSASYSGNQIEPSEIMIAAGKFKVDIHLLLDQNITIPASKIAGQTIQAQQLPSPYRSGGLSANYTFTSYNLKNSDVIVFYALSHNLYDIPESQRSITDLEEITGIEKASSLYWYGAWPEFK